MLAKSYQLVIDNQTGAALSAVAAGITPWKFGTDGALDYSIGEKTQAWTGGVGDNTQDPADAPIDNTTDKGLGAHGEVTLTGTGAGDAYIYLQQSHDGGTTWADVYSNPIGTASDFASNGTQTVEFEI